MMAFLVLLENARSPCMCHMFSYDSHPIHGTINKKIKNILLLSFYQLALHRVFRHFHHTYVFAFLLTA